MAGPLGNPGAQAPVGTPARSGPLGAGAAGGFGGLGGIFNFLSQNGLNNSQYENLGAGATGGNGYQVGGVHGAFSGLSPWAAQWLTQSGMLTKDAPKQQALTDASGAALTGEPLFMAKLLNSLAASGPSHYSLMGGVDQGQLGTALQAWMASSGHSIYAHGYDANGKVAPKPGKHGK